MKKLRFSYTMQMSFSLPVNEHRFTLRCFPISDGRQRISGERTEIYPNQFISSQVDSFGNRCVYGNAPLPHNYFAVEETGIAEVDASKPIPADSGAVGLFKYPTKLTQSGKELDLFFDSIAKSSVSGDFSAKSDLEKAVCFMESLFRAFRYVQGVTGVFTTAEEAFTLSQGVCQDYAHILLALCRKAKIPCRYVAGMMTGEGASHAWVEVASGGKWHALDPTHNRPADENYINISRGRDAQDCSINQGVFCYTSGKGEQWQEVRVSVEEIN